MMFANANSVGAATTQKTEIKAVKNVLKSQIAAANKYSFPDFVKYFDLQYVTSDGFSVDVYSKLVEETWTVYPNIQYAHTIKNVTVIDNDAIAEVVETANAQVQSQYDLKGSLKSVANNIYFLRKTPEGWRILSDVILTENTYLAFGELVNHMPTLTTPYQTLANRNYTATLEYTVPKDAIAIASLNQERVSYPQESMKENYRKLPDDGILERFFTANGDSTNEYVVASVGLTRPKFEGKDLQIGITGIAYIIKRVNVVPENKFINMTDVVSLQERLKKYSEPAKVEEVVEVKEVKAEPSEAVEQDVVPVEDKVENIEQNTVQNSEESVEAVEAVEEKTEAIEVVLEEVAQQAEEKTETIKAVQEDVVQKVEEVKQEVKEENLEKLVPVKLTKEEKEAVKRVAENQKILEKEAAERAKQEEIKNKLEAKARLKEQKAAEKAAKHEAKEKALEGKYMDKVAKLEDKAFAREQREKDKAEKAKLKAEKKAEQKRLKQEKEAQKVEKQNAKKAAKVLKKAIKQEERKEKKLNKGAYSPEAVDIPVYATVCPLENVEVANEQN